MIGKDWIAKAVEEISDVHPATEDEMAEIIIKHCPFKIDVNYMPVPRCDSCKHWNNGVCQRIGISPGPDFGCVQWEAR